MNFQAHRLLIGGHLEVAGGDAAAAMAVAEAKSGLFTQVHLPDAMVIFLLAFCLQTFKGSDRSHGFCGSSIQDSIACLHRILGAHVRP